MITSSPTPATDFCLRMARAHATLIRRFDSALGSVHGISFGDFQLLDQLSCAADGRLRRVDLADCLGVTASGVTRALLPLEKIGLVAREADPRDARVGYAAITPAGKTLLADATVTVDHVSGELLQGVAAESLQNLSTVLGQLAGGTAS